EGAGVADGGRGEDLVLFLVARSGEVAAGELVELADSLGVLVLPGDDAPAPGDPGHRVERGEPGHQVGARRMPVAPRAAGEDVLVVQGVAQGVDVAGDARLADAGATRPGRVV